MQGMHFLKKFVQESFASMGTAVNCESFGVPYELRYLGCVRVLKPGHGHALP